MHTLFDGIPLERDEHVDDDQRDRRVAARALHDGRRGERRRARRPPGHDAERHHQGVPLARDLRVPARPVDAADRRHDRVHRRRGARSGTRSTSAATTSRRRERRRRRRSRTALSTAHAVLDAARKRVDEETFPRVFGRISFFVNAGIRFVEEHAKLRAMGRLWEQLGRERYGVTDEKMLRFRYGVQVNSLGLTESQPENNVIRIVLEALAVTMGRNARARALQLPAWNEALGLPRPWDQQWSLRIQQILAFETDLLEYPDIFEGSKVMDGLVDELAEAAGAEMAIVEEHGGAVEAVDYMKTQLVESHRERVRKIESGELKVIGQNVYTTSEASPLQAGRGRRDPDGRPAGRARPDRGRRGVALEARPGGRGRRARRSSPRRRATSPRTSCRPRSRPPSRARRPASGRRRCATCSASTARRRASRTRAATDDGTLDGAARGGRARLGGARAAGEDPGRQARARRPLERRRADRGPRPRRGHGRRVPGHPPDAVARSRGPRPTRACTWSASRSCRDRTAS